MSFVSSIKPENEIVEQSSTYDFNDKTWESWVKEGFENKIPHDVQRYHDELMKFKAKAGDRPITRTVWRVFRDKPASNGYKECLVIWEILKGTTWANDECELAAYHIVGYHKEQIKRPVINEQRQIVQYERAGERVIHSLPYSKAELDKQIEGQNKESIQFYITNPNGPQSSDFPYEEFILPWNECINLLLQPGGPWAHHVEKSMTAQRKNAQT
jgi:hypothetical protein